MWESGISDKTTVHYLGFWREIFLYVCNFYYNQTLGQVCVLNYSKSHFPCGYKKWNFEPVRVGYVGECAVKKCHLQTVKFDVQFKNKV